MLASTLNDGVAQQVDDFAGLYNVEAIVKETDKVSVGKLYHEVRNNTTSVRIKC